VTASFASTKSGKSYPDWKRVYSRSQEMRLQREAAQLDEEVVSVDCLGDPGLEPEAASQPTLAMDAPPTSSNAPGRSQRASHRVQETPGSLAGASSGFQDAFSGSEPQSLSASVGLVETAEYGQGSNSVTWRWRFLADVTAQPPDCAERVTPSVVYSDLTEQTPSCRSSLDRERSIDFLLGSYGTVEAEDFTHVKVIDSEDEREIAQRRLQMKELQRSTKRCWSTAPCDADHVIEEPLATMTPVASQKQASMLHSAGCSALCTPHKRRSLRKKEASCSGDFRSFSRKQLRPRSTGQAARRLTIDALPADVLALVFRHLKLLPDLSLHSSMVNRSWREVAMDPRLWREVDFEHYERVNDDVVLNYTRRAQGRVSLLDLSKCHQVSNATIIQVVRENRHLRTIRLAWCNSVTDAVVVEIAKCCNELQEIVLACCVHVTGVAIDALAEHCPSLKVVNLACLGKIESQSLVRLFRRCGSLEQLHIVNAAAVDDRIVALMARRLPRLKYLDLSWCAHVTDEAVYRLARYCRDLEHLELGDTKVSSHGARMLLRCCRKLKVLSLPRCVFIDDELIHAILAFAADRLESLNVASCNRVSDDALQLLVEQCTNLCKLDVSKLPCRQLGGILRRASSHLEIFY
jgi:hypothetical protein